MQAARGLTLSSKNPTFSNSKKVFSEISDAIHGPNGWWRGRSYAAASVPSESSDSPKSPKGRKEQKKERRDMVEAFVNEYRALNAGKYPGPNYTRKQVGGSFYNVKKMIQELEYNSKQPPTDMKNKVPLVKDVPKGEYKSVPKVEEISSSKITVGLSSCKPSLRVMDESDTVIINKLDEATSNDFVEKEGPPVSTHVEKPLFEEAADSTKIANDDSRSITTSSKQIVLENKEVLHTRTELPKNSVEETAKSEGLLDLNSKQPPTDMKNKGPLVKDVPKEEYKSVPKVDEVSSSKVTVGLSSCKPSLRVMDESDTVIINKLDEAASNDFVEKEGPPVSTHVEKPLFEEAADSTKIADDDSRSITTSSKQIVLENKEVLHTHTELPKNSVEETAKSEGLLDLNRPERKAMHEDGQKSLKSETLERDMSRKETKEEDQLSTRSTLWGNLMSFADGVIKLWRNK